MAVGAFLVARPASAPCAEPGWLGPTAAIIDPDGKVLYVACERSQQLLKLDPGDGAVMAHIKLEESPTGLALARKCRTLLVTCAGKSDRILSLDPESGSVTASWAAESGVCSPVLSRDERSLYVCNRFAHTVWRLNTGSCRVAARSTVQREPVSLSLSADGKSLAVANLLPTGAAN